MKIIVLAQVFAAILVSPPASGTSPAALKTEEVVFTNGSVRLAGTVVLPEGGGLHPGVVLVTGSGPGERSSLQWHAQQFANLGVVALIYDKRGSGKSTGDWTDASLEDLAQDAESGLDLLAGRRDVDPTRVGIWAISQGGWIVPLVTRDKPRLAFAVVVTGGGVTPREVELARYRAAFDGAALSPEDRQSAEALLTLYFDYLKRCDGFEAVSKNLREAKTASWYALVPLERVLPPPSSCAKWSWVANFDPLPLIAGMKMPSLVLLGGHDLLASQAASRWREGFERAHNTRASVQVLPDVGHALQREHKMGSPPVAEYEQTLAEWLCRFGFASVPAASP